MSLNNTGLALVFLLVALCAVIDATAVCTYRKCWCADKACTTFSGCNSYTQNEGACGANNIVCNCSAQTLSAYASSGCTGSPTNTYHSGSCYSKSFCYYIDSCVA
ncbi:hypothetical protein [Medusavirus stheno T3]|uniref:Uncharacterized protein n=1 Tax=Medusavirus stheno T3 TaxID=3069717 RepID=A0A7S7YEM0_9VIRU|nr:hypothetical protein QKU73_gp402 [Acanthamoeba castellanii medusavirus]QPB44373.1 hypothetical protein [Medusavirus stheno T3]